MDLLTISAFSRLTRLSRKALRLYDQLHLLPPAKVDPDTGYRWYGPGQLEQARHVLRRHCHIAATRLDSRAGIARRHQHLGHPL